MEKSKNENLFSKQELTKYTMYQVLENANKLEDTMLIKGEKSTNNDLAFQQDLYVSSAQVLNQNILDDLIDGKGESWASFVKMYNQLKPIAREKFHPTVQLIGSYLEGELENKKNPELSNWINYRECRNKENLKKAYQLYETTQAVSKGKGGAGGGIAGYIFEKITEKVVDEVVDAAYDYGKRKTNEYIEAEKTIRENNEYIEEQKRRSHDLRMQQLRNKAQERIGNYGHRMCRPKR